MQGPTLSCGSDMINQNVGRRSDWAPLTCSKILNRDSIVAITIPDIESIQDRLVFYGRVIEEIRAGGIEDTRYQAICLWNHDLFFRDA